MYTFSGKIRCQSSCNKKKVAIQAEVLVHTLTLFILAKYTWYKVQSDFTVILPPFRMIAVVQVYRKGSVLCRLITSVQQHNPCKRSFVSKLRMFL